MSSRSNDLRLRIDTEFNGEAKFKSAESSALAMARALDKVDAAQRKLAADEGAAYRERAADMAAHEAKVRKMAAAEMAAYRDAEEAIAKRAAETRRMAQIEAAAYREAEQAAAKAAAARRMAEDQQREALTKVGTAVTAASAATVVGLGIAARAAMDWESAWAGVTKTVEGTPAAMDAVENSLRSLSKVLPATHEEIAAVAEGAGQLGVKTKDVVGFTRVMLDLGETTNLTSEEAATGLAKLMNVMGTAPDAIGRLGSTLVALGNDGASTEADILSMAQRISGAGKLVGASESDVLALANALSSVGIEAELGGGVTTRVLQKIYSAVKDGGDSLAGFAEVAGMSSAQFAAAWQASPIAALDAVFQGLNRVEASGGNVVSTLSDLGLKGTEEATVLLRMKGAGDLLTRSLEVGNQAWAENNALQEEAAKRYATTEARAQMARNTINDAAIDVGGNLLPAVAAGAEGVGNLAAAFGSLSEDQQTFVTALGAGVAGITGVVGVASIAVPKVFELKQTLDELAGGSSRVGKGLGAALSVLTGPWGLALAGATVLVGALAAEQGAAAQRVEALSEAIDIQSGAFTENARALVAKNLQEAGAFDEAKRLGLQLDVVTDAALGNAEAMRKVDAAIQGAYAAYDNNGGDPSQQLLDQSIAAGELANALGDQQRETGKAVEAAKQKAEAMGEDTSATTAAGQASETAAGQVDELGRSTDDSAVSMEKLGDAIRDALGMFFDVENATSAVEEAIDSMTEAVAQNGTTTDLTTEKGRANAKALQDRVTSAGDLIAAMAREGKSTDELSAKTQQLKNDFVLQMQQAGFSQEAIEHYAASFEEIPKQYATQVTADTTAAEERIRALKQSLLAANNIVITPQLRGVSAASPNGTGYYANRAQGGPVYGPGTSTSDSIPARLSDGEYVIRASSVDRYGLAMLDEVNQGTFEPGTFGQPVLRRAGGGAVSLRTPTSTAVATTRPVPVQVSYASTLAGLAPTNGPVDGSRHAAALQAEAASAAAAEAAERRLDSARRYAEKTIERYKEQLQAAEDALEQQHEAAEEALADELDALKKRNSEAERLLKERQSDELDALRAKTKDQARIKALDRAQEAEQRALADRNEKAEEAAQDRIAEAKKANKVASEDLAKSNDRLYDSRKKALAKSEAAEEEKLSAAREAAKKAAEEVAEAERQLNEQRQKAVDLARDVASTLSGNAGLDRLFGDTSAADLTATGKALQKASAAVDAAQRTMRGEDASAALSRRSAALADMVSSATAYASAQTAMGIGDATVLAGLDQVRAKVSDLGAAYGLTAEQVGELTGSLQVQRTSATDLLASRQRELARVTETASAIKSLMAAGLDGALLDQVRAGGTSGLALARALLANPDLIGQFNANQAALVAVSNDLGATIADARFGASTAGSIAGYGQGLGFTTGSAPSATASTVTLDGATQALLQQVLAAVTSRPSVVSLDSKVLATAMNQANADTAFGTAP